MREDDAALPVDAREDDAALPVDTREDDTVPATVLVAAGAGTSGSLGAAL